MHFRSLRKNDEFRLMFADHVHRFLNGGLLAVDSQSTASDPTMPENNVPAARYAHVAVDLICATDYQLIEQRRNPKTDVENFWKGED